MMLRIQHLAFVSIIVLTLPCQSALADTEKTPDVLVKYCPSPDELKKNPVELTWSAQRNTFRSYDLSFATKIQSFAGAQWNGANVGQVTCVYKTLPKPSFPLLLVYNTLALTPVGGAWSKDLGGYKNCYSADIKQCPFKIRIKRKAGNIYEEAEKLKSQGPSLPSD